MALQFADHHHCYRFLTLIGFSNWDAYHMAMALLEHHPKWREVAEKEDRAKRETRDKTRRELHQQFPTMMASALKGKEAHREAIEDRDADDGLHGDWRV